MINSKISWQEYMWRSKDLKDSLRKPIEIGNLREHLKTSCCDIAQTTCLSHGTFVILYTWLLGYLAYLHTWLSCILATWLSCILATWLSCILAYLVYSLPCCFAFLVYMLRATCECIYWSVNVYDFLLMFWKYNSILLPKVYYYPRSIII